LKVLNEFCWSDTRWSFQRHQPEWEDLIKQVEEIPPNIFGFRSALSEEQVEDRMMLIGRGTKEKVQYLLALLN
jgi:hypothetical protein